MTDDIDLSLLDPIMDKYQSQKGVLITVLQEAQEAYGYLPEKVLSTISQELKVSLSRIYAVVTFYAQFYLTPRGRNTIRLCRGTACHVRGSNLILEALEEALGISEGETTEDFQFSLETVACLGTCFLAPVMMVNNSYYGKLSSQQAKTIVKSYAQPGKES
jgi:NADH-quinone oxidoreductase subunit E